MSIAILAIIALAGLVIWIQRATSRQYIELIAETNASIRTLAQATGLHFVEPPSLSSARPDFASAQGLYRGHYVRASVGYRTTDEIVTSLFISGAFKRELASLKPTADDVSADEQGVTLIFASRVPFWRFGLLSYDKVPEKDATRLRMALDRACDASGL